MSLAMLSTEASLLTEENSNGSVLKLNLQPDDIIINPEITLNTSTSSSTVNSNSTHLSDDSHHDNKKDNVTYETVVDSESSNTSNAFMSEVAKLFVFKLYIIVDSRHIFSTDEYPNSFTGQEAINILLEILGNQWSRSDCKRVARSIMPPLFEPILYSAKSVKNNTFYDSAKEVYTLYDDIDFESIQYTQGILTPLLDCYTPLCVKYYSNGCYAYDCPNKGSLLLSKSIMNKDLHRHISHCSVVSSAVSSQDTLVSRSWASAVSRELFQITPSKEMKRQEAIYELIYTEEDYVRDLMLLNELFAQPLSIAQCVEPERRESFCKEIFGNYATILQIHQNMYRELRDYQLTSQDIGIKGIDIGFIDQIGMIVLKYVDQFMDVYTEYGPHFILAEYAVKKEMANNMLFHNFIREKEKQAETRKLPFRHYMILPITRLQRYPLLLEAIIKRTADETEKSNLEICVRLIKKVASKMDELTSTVKESLHLRQINDLVRFKPGAPNYKLDLLDPERTLIYEGPLRRRSHLGESVDLYVFLFDNVLLMTKQRKTASGKLEAYVVSRNPIPLSLLTIGDVVEGSLFTSLRSAHRLSTNIALAENLEKTTSHERPPLAPTLINQSAFLIHHLGRNGTQDVLMTDSPSSCTIWREAIISAQKQLALKEQKQSVFRAVTIKDNLVALGGTESNGKVTCATTFVGSSGDKMLVVGTSQGVWIGKENKGDNLQRVLRAEDVTQVDVIQSHNILLVLADKVLTAYPISQLDPTNPSNIVSNHRKDKSVLASRVLSNHACYFNTGTCHGRTLVVTMKRRGHDSHFKAFEPVCGDLSNPKNSKYISTKTSFMSKQHAWFKLYQGFYIGSNSTAVHFLKSKLLIQCNYGFEVIDPENLNDVQFSLPDLRDSDFSFLKNSEAIPLDIFRYNENFLVCYDQFAFMITSHGKLVRRNYKRIEWEGSPQSVAFCNPYIVAFDQNFIEVRHVDTGDLVQVIVNDDTHHLPSAYKNTNDSNFNIYAYQNPPESKAIVKFEPLQ